MCRRCICSVCLCVFMVCHTDVCIEQADYAGYDLEMIEDGSVYSAIECRSICRKTEGCAFFTWNQKTNNCYLKTEEAILGKKNALTTLGRFSGPRFCNMAYGKLSRVYRRGIF